MRARVGAGCPALRAGLGSLVSGVAVMVLLAATTSVARGDPVSQTRQLPYTLTTLTLYDHANDATFAAGFDRIEAILHKFDMYSPDSEISAVNLAAGKGPVPVSEDFGEALRQALRLSALSGGLFDPTVGPIVKLWRIGSSDAHVPKPEEIEAALARVGWKEVAFDASNRTVSLLRPGMTLDFGAILKGFAAVETGRILHDRGVLSAVADIGGSVLALGSRPDGSPWRIGIQTPGAPTGTYLGIVEVRDAVVNTSGVYEQFFVQNGRRYAHIFDPHTGYPVDSDVESVTVIADRLQNADGPTLAILALGVEKGLAFARQLGVDAVVIGTDRTIHMTAGEKDRFTLSDSSYVISDP